MSTSGAQHPPTPRTSKRAKIWRRTVVGGGLALALTGLLWTVHATQSQVLVLALGAVFAGLCVYEGTHLPKFRELHLQAPAWAAWLAAMALAAAGERDTVTLLASVATVASFGAVGLACLDQRSRGGLDRLLGALLLASAGLVVLMCMRNALTSAPPTSAWYVTWIAALVAGLAGIAFATNAPGRARLARVAMGGLVWLVLPFTLLHHIAADWGVAGLVALVILSKLGDTAGYYAGSAFGRHHPFKTLSPGKTTEGCLASLAAGVAAGVALVHFELLPGEPYGLWGGAAVGALTNLAAQAGDLFESWVKRQAGVKDSGTWFGPSGGVLDLVDSFLFSIPAALVCWPMLLDVAPAAR